MNISKDLTPTKQNIIFIIVVVILITFISFWPSLSNPFSSFDDYVHLVNNPIVQTFDWPHIKAMFTTTINKSYIPLVQLSYAIEHHFFGLKPFIYHLNNLLLHLGVSILIFLLALRWKINLWAAGLGALIFAIHPMHVESVAWITERKDVLYACFSMLSLYHYQCYIETGHGRMKYYVFSLFWVLLSMLSKPMGLSLPLILFLIDWVNKRTHSPKLILEKIPFLVIIIPIVWITYLSHIRIPGESVISGVLIWVWCFAFYIQKFLIPTVLLYACP